MGDRRGGRPDGQVDEGQVLFGGLVVGDQHGAGHPVAECSPVAPQGLHGLLAGGRQGLGEQLLLGAEVAADQGRIDPRVRADLAQADLFVGLLAETVPRRAQDIGARGGGIADFRRRGNGHLGASIAAGK